MMKSVPSVCKSITSCSIYLAASVSVGYEVESPGVIGHKYRAFRSEKL